MDTDYKMFIMIIGIFLIGMIAGYLLNEITVLQDYAESCIEQCNDYMFSQNCKPWTPEEPIFKFNNSLGDIGNG